MRVIDAVKETIGDFSSVSPSSEQITKGYRSDEGPTLETSPSRRLLSSSTLSWYTSTKIKSTQDRILTVVRHNRVGVRAAELMNVGDGGIHVPHHLHGALQRAVLHAHGRGRVRGQRQLAHQVRPGVHFDLTRKRATASQGVSNPPPGQTRSQGLFRTTTEPEKALGTRLPPGHISLKKAREFEARHLSWIQPGFSVSISGRPRLHECTGQQTRISSSAKHSNVAMTEGEPSKRSNLITAKKVWGGEGGAGG